MNIKRMGALAILAVGCMTTAADEPAINMYGNTVNRNMVSAETGLPTKWDLKTGLNIKWSAELGSQSYAGPIVHGGKVFVGTNNQRLYNEKLTGDRGNIIAFGLDDGKLLWQSAHGKLGAGRVNDWPLQGICSTPALEGDRLYYVSNRAEVVCADTEGFLDGENDGPITDEADSSKIDEDLIWKFDMIGELDVFPHNLAAGSPLLLDDMIFTVTGQGVDEGHVNVPSPLGPSFVALKKKTGELVWESALPGEEVLHGTWSNPSYGEVNGKGQVFFPGGDGWLYSFEPKTGKLIWKFNLNPKGTKWILGGRGTKNNVISTPVFYDGKVFVGVGQDPEHGESGGNLWAIDASMIGDVTDKAVVWHRGGEEFHRTLSTASIHDGLMYIADLSGFVYCLDVQTGKEFWKHDTFAAIWGSTFVADGKVYIGDEDGDVAVLQAGKTMKLLYETNMGSSVYTTPVARDGVLYIVSRTGLFAVKEGIPARTPVPKG